MCGRARFGLSAPHICARRGGVDPGAQSDNTGPHGPALLPAGAAGNNAQTPVLQRVSSPPETTVVSIEKKLNVILHLTWRSLQRLCVKNTKS